MSSNHKQKLLGFLLGVLFFYYIKEPYEFWLFIIIISGSAYIDYYSLDAITDFICGKYFTTPLTPTEKNGLHYLLILAMPSLLWLILNRLRKTKK